jgi:pimeloyl-ACP methyl ester carboxylesterase
MQLCESPGQGVGGTLVLLHGLGGSAASYAPLLKMLLPLGHRIVALDLPNHGGRLCLPLTALPGDANLAYREPCMQAVTEVLDACLGERPVTLLGHSLGGWVAMRYALHAPRRIAGLVLQAPDGAPWPQDELGPLRIACTARQMAPTYRLAQDMWPRQGVKAAFMAPFLGSVFAQPAMQALLHSDLLQPVLSPADLHRLPGQVHLILGQSDPFRSSARDAYRRQNLPAASQHHELPIGHADIVDPPAVLRDCLLSILSKVPVA